MIKLKKILWYLSAAMAAVTLFFGFAPLPFGVFHSGMIGMWFFGGTLFLLLFLWNAFDGWGRIPRHLHEVSDQRAAPPPMWWRRTRYITAWVLAGLAIMGAVVSSVMIWSAWFNPPTSNATVIVLGCQIVDDQPSLMLERRLEVALSYLQNNPEAVAVCSGGQNDKRDSFSEAEVMAQYLIERGIAAERIYQERGSRNTNENITFSAKIIRDNQLPESVAIATDGFHQLRGQIYARKNGLSPGGLPAQTPWGLFLSYWVREWFGIAKAVVLD